MSSRSKKIKDFGAKYAAFSAPKSKTSQLINPAACPRPSKAVQSQVNLPVTTSMLSERAYILECGY